jgi:succinyl-CoA synthetase beta subunit
VARRCGDFWLRGADIAKELYVGMVVDRATQRVL